MRSEAVRATSGTRAAPPNPRRSPSRQPRIGTARRCWNWHTGQAQTLLPLGACGFESHPPHSVNAREQIAALPGTDAERRAARDLTRRLEALGRDVDVEPFEVWPAYPLAHLIHAVLAIAGSVISVYSPLVGLALVVAAVVLAFGDGTGLFMLTRRLTGRRASQKVVSSEGGGKPGAPVLVAHYDAGRPPRPFPVLFWSMVAVLLCSLARLAGLDGTALTAVQFVPTVL